MFIISYICKYFNLRFSNQYEQQIFKKLKQLSYYNIILKILNILYKYKKKKYTILILFFSKFVITFLGKENIF